MGWGDRAQRQFGNGNSAIVTPNGDRTVKLEDCTKLQLAQALNEQSGRFKAQRHQLQCAARCLLAIALEPDALSFKDGRAVIKGLAFDMVKDGMEIGIDQDAPGGDVILRVVRLERPAVDVPQIVIR